MSLHDSSIAIAVDDKTWEVVALAMHQTIGVVVRIIGYTNILTHLQGYGETFVPETLVDSLISKGEDANGYGTYLEMSTTNKSTIVRYHINNVALTNAFIHALYGTREHPWMKTHDTFFFAFF